MVLPLSRHASTAQAAVSIAVARVEQQPRHGEEELGHVIEMPRRDHVLQAIGAAVEQRRDHHIEYRIVRSDGTVRWVDEIAREALDAWSAILSAHGFVAPRLFDGVN